MGKNRQPIRLFGREELTHPTLLEGHCERTRAACLQPGRYLLIGDTTEIDYTGHKATVGLGCIGEKNSQRGFLLHSTLAVEISPAQVTSSESGPQVRHERELVGLFDQKLWKRPDPVPLGQQALSRGQPRHSARAPPTNGSALVSRPGGIRTPAVVLRS